MNRFKSKADRDLMRLAINMDPAMKQWVLRLFRMGVRNIRADYILFIRPNGTAERVPDPGAWSGDITPHVGAMLLRGRSGDWWINGF